MSAPAKGKIQSKPGFISRRLTLSSSISRARTPRDFIGRRDATMLTDRTPPLLNATELLDDKFLELAAAWPGTTITVAAALIVTAIS
jgi:hypothetical protein